MIIEFARTHASRERCLTGERVPDETGCAALHCEATSLTDLTVGDFARITCLDAAHCQTATKLAAMGILPGARIQLMRRRPVYVFRIDFAEFAVDETLAGVIRVEPIVYLPNRSM